MVASRVRAGQRPRALRSRAHSQWRPLACVGALVLTLAGCGAAAHNHGANKLRPLPRRERAELILLLNHVLASDQEAIFAYTLAGPLLSHRAQRADARFLGDVNTHAGVLRTLITRAGGRPHSPRASYPLGDPRTETQVLDMLRELEQGQIDLDMSVLPHLASPWARTVLASILANDAQHMAVLRSVQHMAPLQGAFVGGEPPAPAASDPERLAVLMRVELLAESVDRRALRSVALAPGARRLVAGFAAAERDHARSIARALGGMVSYYVYSQPANGPLHGAQTLAPRQWPVTRRGWLHALETVQSRVEGVYYLELPNLTASEALLAASIFSEDAQQSALLGALRSFRVSDAVPAALVRGSLQS